MKIDLSKIEYCGSVSMKKAIKEHFTPLKDHEVPVGQENLVAAYRRLAAELGYNDTVAWKVKAGFELDDDHFSEGPFYVDYNDRWRECEHFHGDEKTPEGIVYFIPKPIVAQERLTHLGNFAPFQSNDVDALRKKIGLPMVEESDSKSRHLIFGNTSLVAGLLLEIFMRTKNVEIPQEVFMLTGSLYWAPSNLPFYFRYLNDSEGERLVCGATNFPPGLHCKDVFASFPLGLEFDEKWYDEYEEDLDDD